MRMRFNKVLCVAGVVLLNLAGSFCQLDVCGQAPFNTKIYGGGDATAGSWPWHVGIGDFGCGGSLINKDWVLSSASCLSRTPTSDVFIQLGRRTRYDPDPHQINRTIINVISHPDYNPVTEDNNIALFQLSSSVDFTDYIRPVCLAAAGSVLDEGLSSWATGWGYTANSGLPNILQEVEIPIVSNQNCSVAYNGSGVTITDNMLCAGQLNDVFKGQCEDDNGGPLVSKQGSQWIQTGVIIMTNACLHKNIPGVFTRVSQYQDWINSHISNEKPGFVTVPYSTPTPDPNPTPDPYPYIPDIFSGSSPSLQLFPLSLTFSIFSLIFCFFI
ncbi:chymotrypsin-like protease CTRL-1 [Misgurnus anguillicaudatus]|uniref:chymotrypsin-like protease CTRL-1 n=1 Tax=Misgurnus anguillicaudatus TaxID=75329 RepID=UPI003CCF7075